ncbi:rRNA maturation RNase YbeY [Aquimarina sp. ERC-38]|uniref:rRNA maturation RNase YbeY n=1 Tax=Aquimarina sp. ERC-38 TaxID=2949996 RepID=UPI002245F68C|nr:rRNA maturation RNase YbeY [Aquimarina sp. ERC-38]UZO81840.1 rRNA maturation RNase YbeY [Aquimarina sp. ERC-38]
MIEFFYHDVDFELNNTNEYASWILEIGKSEGKEIGDINFIFCTDEYLLNINKEFLSHNTYTDIITFDYKMGEELNGEIYISIERVQENAEVYNIDFTHELKRVMSHGILHMCGYEDRTDDDKSQMRKLENDKINLFHVEL